MASDSKWMNLENMLSEVGQAPKNQRLNVFSDKCMTIYNKRGDDVGREE